MSKLHEVPVRRERRSQPIAFKALSFRALAFAAAGALAALTAAVCPVRAEGKRPNVIVIMTDDTGWGDLGFNGGGRSRGAPTPNLDRLAAEGTVFSEWYGQASCTAGRASFMTGRIPIRSALSVVISPGDMNYLHSETPTVAEYFKKNGYSTYFSGKWHLGDTVAAMPINHGFDEMKHFLAYYAGVYAYPNRDMHPDFPSWDKEFMAAYDKAVNDGEWEGEAGKEPRRVVEHFGWSDLAAIDDKQRRSAVHYIKKHARDDKPFFMYIGFLKVHNPTNPAPEWKGKSRESNYLDSLMELDANSGAIVQALRDEKIDKDTIVVWTVDNGAWVDAYPDAGYQPFRGMKGTAFEGGWRVPTVVWWPGHVPAGRRAEGMMSHMDAWPTLAAMAGLTPPSHGAWTDDAGKPIYFDGLDNSALVLGKTGESARQNMIYIEGRYLLGIRHRDWKFVWTAKDTWLGPRLDLELPAIYNLRQDPGEQYDKMFNGAAAPTAGVLKTSPGRWSGPDSGWSLLYAMAPYQEFMKSIKEFPNMPEMKEAAPGGEPMLIAPNVRFQPGD